MRMNLWGMLGGSAIFIWWRVAASQSSSSSSSMVWRLIPPRGDPRPTVVLGLAQRRRPAQLSRTRTTTRTRTIASCLQLGFFGIPEDPGEKELAGVVIDDGE